MTDYYCKLIKLFYNSSLLKSVFTRHNFLWKTMYFYKRNLFKIVLLGIKWSAEGAKDKTWQTTTIVNSLCCFYNSNLLKSVLLGIISYGKLSVFTRVVCWKLYYKAENEAPKARKFFGVLIKNFVKLRFLVSQVESLQSI